MSISAVDYKILNYKKKADIHNPISIRIFGFAPQVEGNVKGQKSRKTNPKSFKNKPVLVWIFLFKRYNALINVV